MEKYIGMDFQEWCSLDQNDDRKINYVLKEVSEGKEHEEHFTSNDNVSLTTLLMVRDSVIQEIELIDNEWFVTLIYEV